jgi:hypothetical protein
MRSRRPFSGSASRPPPWLRAAAPSWILICVALGACQTAPVHSSPPSPGAMSPISVAQRVQAAVDRTAGYELTVTGHNLVLPEWGGIDSGHLAVASRRHEVIGTVYRTGDGLYSVIYVHRMTYFRRATCPTYSLVSGGGALVFTAFTWSMTDAVARAGGLSIGRVSPGILVLNAHLSSLGKVAITVNRHTFLPVRLVSQVNLVSATVTRWTFSAWGRAPEVSAPPPPIAQAGPGGNPC